ncbi:hypothetical protein GCM10020331_060650 [Ectobacillus funiculus]
MGKDKASKKTIEFMQTSTQSILGSSVHKLQIMESKKYQDTPNHQNAGKTARIVYWKSPL